MTHIKILGISFLFFFNIYGQTVVEFIKIDSISILFPKDSFHSNSNTIFLNKLRKYKRNNYQLSLKSYTDAIGTKTHNAILSKKRLTSIQQTLQDAGYTNIVNTFSHGEVSTSASKNDSINRRVDVIIYRRDSIQLNTNLNLLVNFFPGSDGLTYESKPIVNELSEKLKTFKMINIELHGHVCCEPGLEMSLKRVQMVKSILVRNGVSPERIELFAHSNDMPISDESTEAGKAKNRRVEIVFKNKLKK